MKDRMTGRAFSTFSVRVFLLFINLVIVLPVLKAESSFKYPLPPPHNQTTKPAGEKAWLPTGALEFTAKITATDLSRDGKLLALGDEEGYVELYDLLHFTSLWRICIYEEGIPVKLVKISPGKEALAASGGYYPNQSLPLFILNTADGQTVMEMPPQVSFNPDCEAAGNTLDPVDIAWAPVGLTFYILYDSHKLANTGNCLVAGEKYLYFQNLDAGTADVEMVALDPFSKPEGDEPDYPWILGQQFLAVSPDNNSVAVSAANSRICLYKTKKNTKISLSRISRALYLWTGRLGVDASGHGELCFDHKGNIYTLLGGSGELATTHLVKLSPDLSKLEILTYVEEPYPVIRFNADGRYLLVAALSLHLWELASRTALYHGPYGKVEGYLSLLHPGKRLILMVVGKRIHFVVERPAVKLSLGTKWKKTGRYAFHFDSFYLCGEGDIGVGYGTWLREDWLRNEVFFNEGYSVLAPDDDDLNEEGELAFRVKKPGTFVLYGGRTPQEGSSLQELFAGLPDW